MTETQPVVPNLTELPRLNRDQSTMSSSITEALRYRIIEGSLPPGTRISEEWVSREMGVSRGPVREALRELENEGLIIVQAYRGAIVSEISTDDLRDILIPVRLVLETNACLRAILTMTESNFKTLDNVKFYSPLLFLLFFHNKNNMFFAYKFLYRCSRKNDFNPTIRIR